MTYQIGTFFVAKKQNYGYQICYMTGWSSNPKKVGKPTGLAEIVCIPHLKISKGEYRNILEKFGAKYIKLCAIGCFSEYGEMFFDDKSNAEKAADWANSRLTELRLLGQEYDNAIIAKSVQPTLIPKSQIPLPIIHTSEED